MEVGDWMKENGSGGLGQGNPAKFCGSKVLGTFYDSINYSLAKQSQHS
jgi:hypothetical protein